MSNSLEERLQQHSNAFDGLLSLIPAKYYYDEDTSNQWQQKRKSKQEHQNNKRQKLDPKNNKNVTAKDVLKETEKTAKPVVLPGEKMRALLQKQAEADENGEDDDSDDDDEEGGEDDDEDEAGDDENEDEEKLLQENVTIVFDDNGEEVAESMEFKKAEVQKQQKAQKGAGKKVLTPEELEERERKHRELKAKLEAKLQSMREKRKAPGTKVPGAATSRQQILEERRRKLESKKNSKKAVESDSSDDDDEDDDEDDEEDESAKDAADEYANAGANVMFGNIEFADGERVSSDLTSTRRVEKKKGPANKDIKGHLKKLEREKVRKEDMTQEARNKLEDKQKWQKALASVQGLKVKDDEKLLKKALRRKESKKRKSEREWNERIETVANEKKMKADRREENLRIRRENKGKDRKSQTKQLPSYKRSRAHKKLPGAKRAGFEGGIRSGKGGPSGKGGKGGSGGKPGKGGKR